MRDERKLLKPLLKRYTEEEIRQAMEKSYGSRTMICRRLDCTQKQLENLLDRKPELLEFMETCREEILDKAEQALMDNLVQDEDRNLKQKAAEFVLKNLGAGRGYAGNLVGTQIRIDEQRKITQINAIFGIND